MPISIVPDVAIKYITNIWKRIQTLYTFYITINCNIETSLLANPMIINFAQIEGIKPFELLTLVLMTSKNFLFHIGFL